MRNIPLLDPIERRVLAGLSQLWSSDEAAFIASCSPSLIRTALRNGHLEGIKAGLLQKLWPEWPKGIPRGCPFGLTSNAEKQRRGLSTGWILHGGAPPSECGVSRALGAGAVWT